MRSVVSERLAEQSEIQRTLMQGTARLCSRKFGRVCKVLWPIKTAEELAARAGYKSTRTAAYEIAGERPPSAKSLGVIIAEILNPD